MRSFIDEARGTARAVHHGRFDRHAQIGQGGQASLEEGDGRIFRPKTGGGGGGGTHLMVDVVVGEERRERLHVVRVQRRGEALCQVQAGRV